MAVELQLGLALPTDSVKGLDLNAHGCEPKVILELESPLNPIQECYSLKRKRSCGEAFVQHKRAEPPQTLPLLLWNDQPNDEDDPNHHYKTSSSTVINENESGGESVMVGWPPIKSWRKKHVCGQNRGGRYAVADGSGGGGNRASNWRFVKVKMEAVGIARKVDLTLHNSYEALMDTLLAMFGKWNEEDAYKLAYQDTDGDWLLAGDVPWRSFVGSVQRLKLLKNNS